MRLEAADETGRPRPVAIPGSEYIAEADTVIRAIGQTRLQRLGEAFQVETAEGVIRVDEDFRTSNPKVFAAGDCTFERGRGEAMVVEAAEQGKRAARSVHRYLSQAQRASCMGGNGSGGFVDQSGGYKKPQPLLVGVRAADQQRLPGDARL